jgi:hypothetical protein
MAAAFCSVSARKLDFIQFMEGERTMEPIATIDEKRQLLLWLRNSDKKYRRPFDSGEMAVVNILGGSWNDYAQVVFNMLIADTLVNIEEQLGRIADSVGESDPLEA